MFDLIRHMPDVFLALFVLCAGIVGWFIIVAGFLLLSKLWDKLTTTTMYQCVKLRHENAALKKKLREARQIARR